MRLDAAPTPRQICACFPRMLLGLDYANPRAADNFEPRSACCGSWIAYRDEQRAKFPNTKPDVEPLPPDTAEGQWRKWLAEPKALKNLKLNEDELWIAVGYLQLQGKTATKPVPGRPGQARVDHIKEYATCNKCMKDALKPDAKATHEARNQNRTADQLVAGNLCTACGNRKADGKNTGKGSEPPCAACAEKRAAKAAARST
jgi:hypothetical protein